ncbi:predicted protein [Sclerotinia sclerotiorum 1980 UF-70]|uniref:Uncharacterized protein n=1 Tax=Sclerotinia sclerotiorum (strain ATCC 18683 / 1980 / Ss-1) TaxID=665079 RepID=A7E5K7_SCLS1|nr:predicted protein [Sclerotinia sclerotiorum 1980 UF-70]EDN91179.1 predicted protein [Sclerotinia sclerotiorum 1980 UF-70]
MYAYQSTTPGQMWETEGKDTNGDIHKAKVGQTIDPG